MTDWAGFVASIVANPDDDLYRLVAADWLEENGRPERAEFIRAQCELAKCPHDDSYTRDREGRPVMPEMTCERCGLGSPLRQRERELLMGNAWTARDLSFLSPWNRMVVGETPHPDNPHPQAFFSRGFPSRLTLSWQDWQTRATALLAACPLTGKDGLVRLTTWPEVSQARTAFGSTLHRLAAGDNVVWLEAANADVRDVTPELLNRLWPAVRFSLPDVARIRGYFSTDADVSSLTRGLAR